MNCKADEDGADDLIAPSSSLSSVEQQMTTTSHHFFGDSSENSDAFSITIIEVNIRWNHHVLVTLQPLRLCLVAQKFLGKKREKTLAEPKSSFALRIFFLPSTDSRFMFAQHMQEDYGLFVWPCSVVLAEYVWQQRLRFSGVSVVELGSGTSLPGLVAAKVGSHVTLTDDSNRPERASSN
ncbi:hypothetical protein U1Q18_011514 [Sarracenia purpurea var. burkii]